MWYKAIPIFVVLGCVVSLTACGSLPKPFSHSEVGKNNPLLALAGGGAVRVRVNPDLPASLAKPLIDNMIKSLWDEHVPASAAATFLPRYLLDGDVKIIYPSVSEPEQVEIIWTLSTAAGQKIDAFDQRVSGDRAGWLFLDKELLADLSFNMGQEVVRMLYAQQRPNLASLKTPPATPNVASQAAPNQAPAASQLPAETSGDSAILFKKPKIYLAEIIGAPGDGNKSLYRNLYRSIIIAGAEVVTERPNSEFLVKGFVNVSPPYDASNDVAITWLVTTNEGKELGKVTQNNRVPAGALNGRWGDMAHVIAQGGSIGVIDIIERHLSASINKRGLVVP